MNKVISGKRYDTETAKKMGCADNGVSPSDFTFWSETLYRTKSGNYFLHGEGHGNSRYGEWHGNSGGWGERIIPLDEGDAKTWAENSLTGNQAEAIFGAPAEKIKISAELPEDVKEKLDLIKGRMSYGEIISEMVRGWEQC